MNSYSRVMKDRIVNKTIDRDNNIVVTIRKYGWLKCLFHSIWGIVVLLCMAGFVSLLAKQQWVAAIVLLIFSTLAWAKAWLHSNDKLKSCIYITLLKDFLRKSMSEEDLPIIIRYDFDGYVIKTMMKDGELRDYKVEHIMEKLPLYAVKIHTKIEKN